MFSLDCKYYHKEFETIELLLSDIIKSGMDASYEITKNGKGIGQNAFELIIP